MAHTVSTRHWSDSERQPRWAQAIGSAYFPLSLEFAASDRFSGNLQIWETASTPLTLSRLRSSQLGYSRSKAQVSEDQQACYLVTVPRRSEVHFEQDGRALHCQPGGFIFERGDAPYRFHYASDNDLWVFKLPEQALHGQLRGAERYTRFCFDARRALGRIFVDQLAMCAARFDECAPSARHMLLEQALSTLLMALRDDERVLVVERRCDAEGAGVVRRLLAALDVGDAMRSPQSLDRVWHRREVAGALDVLVLRAVEVAHQTWALLAIASRMRSTASSTGTPFSW